MNGNFNAKSEYVEHHRWQIAGADSHPEAANWTSCLEPEPHTVPCVVYSLNGEFCAVITGMDELLENDDCAKEIARLAARERLWLEYVDFLHVEFQKSMALHVAHGFGGDLVAFEKGQRLRAALGIRGSGERPNLGSEPAQPTTDRKMRNDAGLADPTDRSGFRG